MEDPPDALSCLYPARGHEQAPGYLRPSQGALPSRQWWPAAALSVGARVPGAMAPAPAHLSTALGTQPRRGGSPGRRSPGRRSQEAPGSPHLGLTGPWPPSATLQPQQRPPSDQFQFQTPQIASHLLFHAAAAGEPSPGLGPPPDAAGGRNTNLCNGSPANAGEQPESDEDETGLDDLMSIIAGGPGRMTSAPRSSSTASATPAAGPTSPLAPCPALCAAAAPGEPVSPFPALPAHFAGGLAASPAASPPVTPVSSRLPPPSPQRAAFGIPVPVPVPVPVPLPRSSAGGAGALPAGGDDYGDDDDTPLVSRRMPAPFAQLPLAPAPPARRAPRARGVLLAAVFLTPTSREVLLACVPPLHADARADHMTLAFKPTGDELLSLPLGAEVQLRVIGQASDGRAQALAVDPPEWLPPTGGAAAHVTLSVAPGAEAKEAGAVLSDAMQRTASGGLEGGGAPGAYEHFQEPLVLAGYLGAELATGERVFSLRDLLARGLLEADPLDLADYEAKFAPRLAVAGPIPAGMSQRPYALPDARTGPPPPTEPLTALVPTPAPAGGAPAARPPWMLASPSPSPAAARVAVELPGGAPAGGLCDFTDAVEGAPARASPPAPAPAAAAGPPPLQLPPAALPGAFAAGAAAPLPDNLAPASPSGSAGSGSMSSGSSDGPVVYLDAVRAGDYVVIEPWGKKGGVDAAGRAVDILKEGWVKALLSENKVQINGVLVMLQDGTVGHVAAVRDAKAAALENLIAGQGVAGLSAADALRATRDVPRPARAASGALDACADAADRDMQLWLDFEALQCAHGESLCQAVLEDCNNDFEEAIRLLKGQADAASAAGAAAPGPAAPAPAPAGWASPPSSAWGSPQATPPRSPALGAAPAPAGWASPPGSAWGSPQLRGRATPTSAASPARPPARAPLRSPIRSPVRSPPAPASPLAGRPPAPAGEGARADEAARLARARGVPPAAAAALCGTFKSLAPAAVVDALAAAGGDANAAAEALLTGAPPAPPAPPAPASPAPASPLRALGGRGQDPAEVVALRRLTEAFPNVHASVIAAVLSQHNGDGAAAARALSEGVEAGAAAQRRNAALAGVALGGMTLSGAAAGAGKQLSEAEQLQMLRDAGEYEDDASDASSDGGRSGRSGRSGGSAGRAGAADLPAHVRMLMQQGRPAHEAPSAEAWPVERRGGGRGQGGARGRGRGAPAAGQRQDWIYSEEELRRMSKEELLALETRLRAEADQRCRNAGVFRAAVDALQGRDNAAVVAKVRQWQEMHNEGRRLQEEAMRISSMAHNIDVVNEHSFDLHGQSKRTAVARAEEILSALAVACTSGGTTCRLIVGQGKHSKDNQSVIREKVLEYLRQAGWNHELDSTNPGVIKVYLTQADRGRRGATDVDPAGPSTSYAN